LIVTPRKKGIPLDVEKIGQLAKKIYLSLRRQSENPLEIYAALLMIKIHLEVVYKIEENGFHLFIKSYEKHCTDSHKNIDFVEGNKRK